MGYSRLWRSPGARLWALVIPAFVAAAILALATPDASEAAFPGQNARIAFEEVDDSSTDIVSVNPEGTGRAAATNDETSLQPNWSADGKRLAYISESEGSEGSTFTVFVQNIAANGAPSGTPTEVAQTSGPFGVAFSPDGRWVAYARNVEIDGTTYRNLFASRSDGSGGEVQITNEEFDDAFPNWSADGGRIVFQRTTRSEVDLTDIHVVNVGANLTPGTSTQITGNGDSFDPNFSPDGARIAYHSIVNSDPFDGASISEIFVVASDGSGTPQRITESSADDSESFSQNAAVSPAFSPDGAQITYAKYTSGPAPLSLPLDDVQPLADVSPMVFPFISLVEAEVRRIPSSANAGSGTFVAEAGSSVFFPEEDSLVAPDWQPLRSAVTPNPPGPQPKPRPPEVVRCLNEPATKATIAPKKRANLINGTTGGDVIVAPAGANTVYGGPGDDIILVRGGAATVYGGGGDDVIVVATPSISTVYAGTGRDSVCVYVGASTVHGDPGSDGVTVAGEGSSTVYGGPGNEVIHLQRGRSTARGGAGNDRIIGNRDASTMYGGTGRDFIRAFARTTVFARDGRGGDVIEVRGQPRSVYKDPGDILRSW